MTVSTGSLTSSSTAGVGFLAALRNTLSVWVARVDMRRELSELSERELVDAGLNPLEIEREIAKPFWRA